MMKCFMSKFKIVAIDKVCWKAKMKDWDCMSAISVWDNVHNYFNNKYMANNKQKNKPHVKQFKIPCHLQLSFRIQRIYQQNTSLTIIHNKLKRKTSLLYSPLYYHKYNCFGVNIWSSFQIMQDEIELEILLKWSKKRTFDT